MHTKSMGKEYISLWNKRKKFVPSYLFSFVVGFVSILQKDEA